MTDKSNRTSPEDASKSNKRGKRPYQAPTLRSTKAFERLALLSCPGASEAEGDCDEI